jgi:hypothetical protein
MFLSDILKGGQSLRGKAGAAAINAGNLLQIDSFGNLSSVVTADYAATANTGGNPIASTTSGSVAESNSTNNTIFQNPVDGSIYVCGLTASTLQLAKYSAAGALLGTVVLAGGGTYLSVRQLSNGNLVVTWGVNTAGIYFAIVDTSLNIIVPQTTIGSSTSTDGSSVCVPLSGGGFAVLYATNTGAMLAIYSNAGVVVLAASGVAGSPASVSYKLMVQLSNGNLVIVLSKGTSTYQVVQTIVSPTGAVVLATTVVYTGTATTEPWLSQLNGFYAIATYDPGVSSYLLNAYIYNNTGTLQGANFSVGTNQGAANLGNDGTAFVLTYTYSGGGTGGAAVYLPTTGTNYVSATLKSSGTVSGNVLYDSTTQLYLLGSAGVYQKTASNTFNIVGGGTSINVGTEQYVCGDYCFLWYNYSSYSFGVTKYLNTAIVGVSQQTLAAGNAGTLVAFSHGGGAGKNGYPTNQILGTVGKSFDHSATNIVGNKGTILGNCVALEGIV